MADLETRKQRLAAFEEWSDHRPLPLAEWVGDALWTSYWARLEEIERLMFEAQAEAEAIRVKLAGALKNAS